MAISTCTAPSTMKLYWTIGYSVNTMPIGLDDYKLRSFPSMRMTFTVYQPSTFIPLHFIINPHHYHLLMVYITYTSLWNHHHDTAYPENLWSTTNAFAFTQIWSEEIPHHFWGCMVCIQVHYCSIGSELIVYFRDYLHQYPMINTNKLDTQVIEAFLASIHA